MKEINMKIKNIQDNSCVNKTIINAWKIETKSEITKEIVHERNKARQKNVRKTKMKYNNGKNRKTGIKKKQWISA